MNPSSFSFSFWKTKASWQAAKNEVSGALGLELQQQKLAVSFTSRRDNQDALAVAEIVLRHQALIFLVRAESFELPTLWV